MIVATGAASGFLLLRKKASALYFIAFDLALRLLYMLDWSYSRLRSHPLHLRGILIVLLYQLIAIVAWFFYFKMSRRVRNTLGKNLGSA